MTISSFIHLSAMILSLSVVFGLINHHWLKLPHTIGVVVMALLASLGVIAIDALAPALGLGAALRKAVAGIDFYNTLMQGMLGFLLFAGALHVDLDDLVRRGWAIGLLATLGVLISTALIGGGAYFLLDGLGIPAPLIWCLVFGALISPTDPVAVMGILKVVAVPKSLKAKIAGESLFNDGVGVVVFSILVAAASSGAAGGGMDAVDVALLFVHEAGGGAVLGLLTGGLAFIALRSLDEYVLEVLITLALVFGATSLALLSHASAPIAVVVAGLLIGNHGRRLAMSETTRDHVQKFWTLIDEILNSALFLLIGFEVVVLSVSPPLLVAALAAVPLALAARWISVAVPLTVLRRLGREYSKGAIPVLAWGGLRGGISVALALSLPMIPEKPLLLTMTYGVVLFSIIVQGLSVEWVIRRFVRLSDEAE